MNTYRGTEIVPAGLYFETHELEFVARDERGPLPGTATNRYLRVPALAMLVVGPVLGLVYAMFLPFIGLYMVARLLVEKLALGALEVANAMTRVLRPAWQPARAFFGRGKARPATKPTDQPAATTDAWAEQVQGELTATPEPPLNDRDDDVA
jgi:hypothetical protein